MTKSRMEAFSDGVLAIIITMTYNRYVKRGFVTPADSHFNPALKTLFNKYYVDELYEAIIVKPLYWLSDLFYKIFDIRIIYCIY